MCDKIKEIEKENWRHAKGIKLSTLETNSALAERDYSVKCDIHLEIANVDGYHIWWCSCHHQPLAWCENDKMKIKLDEMIKEKQDVLDILTGKVTDRN